MRQILFVLLFLLSVAGLGEDAVRTQSQLFGPLTKEQKLEDFHYLVSLCRNYYAPLDRKSTTAQLDFEKHVKETEETIIRDADAGGSDGSYFDILARFVTRFQDAHAAFIRPDMRGVDLGFSVRRVVKVVDPLSGKEEEKAIVTRVDSERLSKDVAIAVGDELVSMNGKTPGQICDELEKFVNWSAPQAKRDMIFAGYLTRRSGDRFNVEDLVGEAVELRIKDKSDREHKIRLHWLSTSAQVSLPYIDKQKSKISPETSKAEDNAESLKKHSFFGSMGDQCRAIKYEELLQAGDLPDETEKKIFENDINTGRLVIPKFAGATGICSVSVSDLEEKMSLGVMPIKTYLVGGYTDAYLRLYRRLIKFFEKTTDALLIDQTENGGGSAEYMRALVSLLTPNTLDMGTMAMPVNRNNYRMLTEAYLQAEPGTEVHARYRDLCRSFEECVENNQALLEGAEYFFRRDVAPYVEDGFTPYSKPLFVLIDSLCASGGDWFPGVMKSNDRAVVIGTHTMGAGGNVQSFGPLPNSTAQVSLTMNFFVLSNGDYVEDKGIEPHHTVRPDQTDYREGFGNKGGFRDKVLKIVSDELEEKVLLPKLKKQEQEAQEKLKKLTQEK